VQPNPRRPRSGSRASWYVLGALWLLPALLVVGGVLFLPDTVPAGRCEGLGFGCTLAPSDQVRLLGMLFGPFFLIGGLVALLLLVALRRWPPFRRAPQSVQAGAVVGLLAAAAAVVVALA
jgi:hypothetical protein